ncbi:MAG: class I SAM-dependent methyltransferase [Bacteroidales bacterium]|jgi:2-polyprenyl-3-methyl-5-hydroxy-6-metoxy-1,4-benzoquinol methylase|nr:class I SAM-dependent methyltransferase [Bacteroidales bacterium]
MNAEKFWDSLSNNFDKRVKKYTQLYIKSIAKTKKHLNTNDIVLDYACGTGLIANEIATNVKHIYAIDISSKMIEAAKRKADKIKIKNIDFVQSTIFDEKYKKESFDVILAFNILHIVKDTHKLMQRINELLKPGGLIISTTACLGEKHTFLNILISILNKIGIAQYMNLFKIPKLENVITKGNFQIIETETLFHTPMNYFIVAKKI